MSLESLYEVMVGGLDGSRTVRTAMGEGRMFYDLRPEQFASGVIGVFREQVYQKVLSAGERAMDIRTAELRSEGELGVAATLIGEFGTGKVCGVDMVVRVNVLMPENFREPVDEGIVWDLLHEDDRRRYLYSRVVEAGHEARDGLLEKFVNYGLMQVSGEESPRSVVTPMMPASCREATAAIQIGVNNGVVGALIDFSAITLCRVPDRV